MKYIRTKDKIYEFGKIGLVGKEMEKDFFERPSNSIFESEIVKQANTIEELGDIYVIVSKDGKAKPYTTNTLSVFDDFEDVLKHNDIYMSIWVGALLKPVAKMNDKGELELCSD